MIKKNPNLFSVPKALQQRVIFCYRQKCDNHIVLHTAHKSELSGTLQMSVNITHSYFGNNSLDYTGKCLKTLFT